MEPTPTGAPHLFRVIAYVTAAVVPEVIPYERLTHINYAFIIPNADGSFAPFANGWKLKKIAAEGKAGGVMFWTLEHDAVGELSLLRAIDAVAREK